MLYSFIYLFYFIKRCYRIAIDRETGWKTGKSPVKSGGTETLNAADIMQCSRSSHTFECSIITAYIAGLPLYVCS